MERTKHHITVGLEFADRKGKLHRVSSPAHLRDDDGNILVERWQLEHLNYGRWQEGQHRFTTVELIEYIKSTKTKQEG